MYKIQCELARGIVGKMGFTGLSGNAGRSSHGVRSMESAVSGRRVEQAALTAKEHRLESLCAQRSFTPLFREEWREYKTAQRVSTRWVHRPQAGVPAPPDKKN